MIRIIVKMTLGVILLISSTYSLVAIGGQIFNDSFRNGQTIIHLEILDEVNKDEIKEVVASSINIGKSGIKVEDGEGDLVIRMDLIEENDILLIETSLLTEYGREVKIIRHSAIGKSRESNILGLVLTYILLFLILLLSIRIVYRNIILFLRKVQGEYNL